MTEVSQTENPQSKSSDGEISPEEAAYNLNRLGLAHYIVGAVTAVSALPMIPHLLTSWEIAHHTGDAPLSENATQLLKWVRLLPNLDRPEFDDPLIGVTLVMVIAPVLAMLIVHGFVLVWMGKWVKRRKRYLTTFIISVFNLTNFPLGTAVSAVTVAWLLKPEYKRLYGRLQVEEEGRKSAS